MTNRQQHVEDLAEKAILEIYQDIKTRTKLELIPFHEGPAKPQKIISKIKTIFVSKKWLWITVVSSFLAIVLLYATIVLIDGTKFIIASGITSSLIGLVMMIHAGLTVSFSKDDNRKKKIFISGHAINKRYIFGFALIILGFVLQLTGLFK